MAKTTSLHELLIEELKDLAVLILAVPHRDYSEILNGRLNEMLVEHGIFVDVKSMVEPSALRTDLHYWSL